MDFIFNQMVQFEHGHNTHSYRLVKRFTGFPVHQNLLPDNRYRVTGLQTDVSGLVAQFSFIIGNRCFAFGGDPQPQAGMDSCLIFRQNRRRIRLYVAPVDNGVRIKAIVTQPFSQNSMFQLNVFIQIIHRDAALIEDFSNIGTADFIVIFEGSGVDLMFMSPIPGLVAPFFPGCVEHPGAGKFGFDFVFCGTVEHRGDRAESQTQGSPTKVDFQNLTDVHTARNAQRIQDDIDRSTVFEIRHIFHRNHTGNDTLVTMTSGHFVTGGELTALCDGDADTFVDACGQISIVIAAEDLDINHFSAFTVRHAQGIIFNVAGLFTKDGAQQSFFRCQFFFTLRGDFPDDNVARAYFGADADNTVFIQIFDGVITDIRYITGDFFRTKLCFQSVMFIFFDMDRGEFIRHYHTFGNQDRVFKVAAFPGNEGYDNVLTQCQLTVNG